MSSQTVRTLAEENLVEILKRAKQNGGRISPDDLPSFQGMCRAVEIESGQGYYGNTAAIPPAMANGRLAGMVETTT